MRKKAQVQTIAPAILALVFASVVLIFGLVILQELRGIDVIPANGYVFNQTNATIVGLGTFADFWAIIVLAIVITVVIGLLLIVFGTSRTR